MIRYINQYMELRNKKSSEIEYFSDRVEGTYSKIPFLIEMITEHEQQLSVERKGLSVVSLPPNTKDQLLGNFSNRTSYEIPHSKLKNDHLFIIDFQDFSLKLTYEEAQLLMSFLQSIEDKI